MITLAQTTVATFLTLFPITRIKTDVRTIKVVISKRTLCINRIYLYKYLYFISLIFKAGNTNIGLEREREREREREYFTFTL